LDNRQNIGLDFVVISFPLGADHGPSFRA